MQFTQATLFDRQRPMFPTVTPKTRRPIRLYLAIIAADSTDDGWKSILISPEQLGRIRKVNHLEGFRCKPGCRLDSSFHPCIEWKEGEYTKYCTADVIREIPEARAIIRQGIMQHYR